MKKKITYQSDGFFLFFAALKFSNVAATMLENFASLKRKITSPFLIPYLLPRPLDLFFYDEAIRKNYTFAKMLSPDQHIDNFDSLFREYYPAAVLFAQKMVKDSNAAKDIAQQVFVKIYEKKDDLKIEISFKAYLFRAVRNTALTYLKKEKTHLRHSEVAFSLKETATVDNDPLEYQELVKKLDELINGLPPRCQLVFKMNRFDGKKNKEIAEELGISIRTVEAQISHALKVLRKKLPKELLMVVLLFLGLLI